MKERKAAVISFTRAGMQTASLVSGILKNRGWKSPPRSRAGISKKGTGSCRKTPEF